jgi:hypothetical protein
LKRKPLIKTITEVSPVLDAAFENACKQKNGLAVMKADKKAFFCAYQVGFLNVGRGTSDGTSPARAVLAVKPGQAVRANGSGAAELQLGGAAFAALPTTKYLPVTQAGDLTLLLKQGDYKDVNVSVAECMSSAQEAMECPADLLPKLPLDRKDFQAACDSHGGAVTVVNGQPSCFYQSLNLALGSGTSSGFSNKAVGAVRRGNALKVTGFGDLVLTLNLQEFATLPLREEYLTMQQDGDLGLLLKPGSYRDVNVTVVECLNESLEVAFCQNRSP